MAHGIQSWSGGYVIFVSKRVGNFQRRGEQLAGRPTVDLDELRRRQVGRPVREGKRLGSGPRIGDLRVLVAVGFGRDIP